MLYPLVVPLLLIQGENILTQIKDGSIASLVGKEFFYPGGPTNKKTSNYSEYIYNKTGYKYHIGRSVFSLPENELKKKENTFVITLKTSETTIDCTTINRINDFLFLCQIYNLELKQKRMQGYDHEYIYKEMKDKLSGPDYILFWKAVRIAAYAADGAPEFLKKKDADSNTKYMDQVKEKVANAVRGIRERRRVTPRPKGGVYFGDLMSVLDSFFDRENLPHTLIDLLKLTIIDPESLDVWSGKESSHFLDSIGDEIYTLVMSPEFFFSHNNGHEQYLHNLMSVAINPNEAHFCYVENKLRKYTNDISAFVTELLLFTYNELLTNYDVDDSKKEQLINAGKYIRGLTKPESLDENEKTARKYLLLEMYIHLICAVLTNNWEDIKLIPMMRTLPELIQAPDSIISHINTTGLNKYLRGESSDDSALTNALAMYEEAGRLITSNESLLKWFDERYSKQFLVLISSSQAQNRLFAEGSSYPNIFSLYRRWLARKKAYIYTCYQEISLRSDIISMKICNDYMKLYREDKSAVLPFAVIDNSEVSRSFGLRQASIDDFKEVKQMNDKEFSRKVFVKSPDKELEFGINNGTIWLVKNESTDTMVAFFIIVPIENNERLAQMEGVYGTATLAHEYAIENNCIDKPFVIFDAVIVEPKYRGLGFQRLGLLLAEYLGKDIAAEFICATVSPANIPSSRNFQLLDYKKIQTVYYPSSDTSDTPGRRYNEPTDYYTAHKSECDDEVISPEILSFLRENHISDEDYKQERVAVRDFVVFNIT